jgi:hypothetical protein
MLEAVSRGDYADMGCYLGKAEKEYLVAASLTPSNAIVATSVPPENLILMGAWRHMLGANWRELARYSSTDDVDELSARLSLSGICPTIAATFSRLDLASALGLTVDDASVVWLALHQQSRVVRASASANLPPVTNLNFILPHIQKRDFTSTTLATKGPAAVLTAENASHTAITIPASLALLADARAVISPLVQNVTDAYGTIIDDSLIPVNVKISIGLTMLYRTLITVCLITSLVSVFVSSPDSHSDYSAAKYLSIRPFLRYADSILFFAAVVFIGPAADLALRWGPDSNLISWLFFCDIASALAKIASVCITAVAQILFITSLYNVNLGKVQRVQFISNWPKASVYLEAIGHFNKGVAASKWKKAVAISNAQI